MNGKQHHATVPQSINRLAIKRKPRPTTHASYTTRHSRTYFPPTLTQQNAPHGHAPPRHYYTTTPPPFSSRVSAVVHSSLPRRPSPTFACCRRHSSPSIIQQRPTPTTPTQTNTNTDDTNKDQPTPTPTTNTNTNTNTNTQT